MKIGIIGSGRIGGTLGRLFVEAGHEVMYSSRHPKRLWALVKGVDNSFVGTPVEAVAFGDIVLLAIPWRDKDSLPSSKLFAGKIVIDVMNPYSSTGDIIDLGDSTSSEEVAKRLPGVRIVKAFNTMYYETLRTGSRKSTEDRLVIFVAVDDLDAKDVISKLIEEIGFASIETGSLRDVGRRQEPGSSIYNKPLKVQEAKKILKTM